jgi:hypothetical protein
MSEVLKGRAHPLPGINAGASREPCFLVNLARQLYLMGIGARAGAWIPLMKGVVENLTNDDVVAIPAYLASLEP